MYEVINSRENNRQIKETKEKEQKEDIIKREKTSFIGHIKNKANNDS